jgi:hypothetical protein
MEGTFSTARFPLPDPPQPPMPLSAVWNGATRRVTVTFDTDILPVAFSLANWRLTHSGGIANPSSASVSGAVITLQFVGLTGVSLIGYDPPPFDVVGAPPNGLAVEAFTWPL